ncbi:MAG: biotin--[acetyl-CoA-carboxylase] ligase [Pseudomonadota bacterium]|nr:biotin--[acetyl-CoA-carboxylase] ligase [Pseudomonadota bacterium]
MNGGGAPIRALRAAIGDGRAALHIDWIAATGSTNADLLATVRAGADLSQPRLLIADRQSAGRGRQGRPWTSLPGASLTFSLAWQLERSEIDGLSLAIGSALADALDPASTRLGLKWPNDLWLIDPGDGRAGRKLGGILIETAPSGEGRVAVIGIGLNVLEQRVDGASSGVAWLREIDPEATPPAVLCRAVPALLDALARFEQGGFADFADRFAARDLLRGRAVRCGVGIAARTRVGSGVNASARATAEADPDAAAIEGIAVGVSASGALLVRTERGVVPVVSGEVSVRLSGRPSMLSSDAARSTC